MGKDSPVIIIMSIKLLVTTLVIVQTSLAQQIIDYSHSQYLERREAVPHTTYSINIHPDKAKNDYLEFPLSCSLQASLSSTGLVEQTHKTLESEEKQIQKLKANMTHLLQLSERIRTAKHFLKQYSFSQEFEVQEIHPSSLSELESAESELLSKREHINSLVQQLAELIHKQLNSSKKNGFAEMQLNFEQRLYQTRLNYLLQLRDTLKQAKPTPSTNFNLFFDQVQTTILTENKDLAQISEFLGKYSVSNELKLRISNLQNQLQAIELMIKEKDACFDRKGELMQHESRRELEKTYNELKSLKRKENPNSEYCEGVTLSLLKQLKKVLKIYNYSFACSEGLPELQNSKIILHIELQRLNQTYQEIDFDGKVQYIRKFLRRQEDLRTNLVEEVQRFRLNQYNLDISTIEAEIQLNRDRLAQIQQQMQNPSSHKQPIDYDQLRNLIASIEEQQHSYCQLKQTYQKQYTEVDVSLRLREHVSALKISQYSNYVSKYNQLRELERQFSELKNSLIEQLR